MRGCLMQFDSIAESSYRSFLQFYQAALGNHLYWLSKTPYVYFCIFQFTLVWLHICMFFQTKSLKTYTVLILYCFFCTIFSLKRTYSRTLNINIIQSGITYSRISISRSWWDNFFTNSNYPNCKLICTTGNLDL